MSKKFLSETRSILVFIGIEHKVSALHQTVSSDMEDEDTRLLVGCGLGFAIEPGESLPDPDDYVLVDWDTFKTISERQKISEIGEPSIVLLLLNEPLPKLATTASSLKQWIMQSEMRHEVEKHVQKMSPRIAISSKGSQVGSKEEPFESAQQLLSFLERSEPDQYVFRGQCQEYDLPVLPSGYRRWFRPVCLPPVDVPQVNFPQLKIPFTDLQVDLSEYGGFPLVGVTYLDVEIEERRKEEILKYNKKIGDKGEVKIIRGEGITGWDVLLSPPKSFREHIIKIPHERAVECRSLGEICVNTLEHIFGKKLGMMLAQQYGLTSILLDATTNPKVALFFATRKFPFYWSTRETGALGVVYRWPRDAAIVAEDLLKPLEQKDFESVGSSFKRFVEESEGLEIWPDDASMIIDDRVGVKLLHIVVHGEERALYALPFPEGSFEKSRFGRQHAAFLYPLLHLMEADAVSEQTHPKKVRLEAIGDLLKTHRGEAFYFRHSEDPLDLGSIDKFYLWPIRESPDFVPEKLASLDSAEGALAALRGLELQDKYLELLLLLLSPWSPVQILLWSRERGKPQLIAAPPRILVHPGFAIHPEEAQVIAWRLFNKSSGKRHDEHGNLTHGPISFPIGMLIPSKFERKFYRIFRKSTQEILKIDKHRTSLC